MNKRGIIAFLVFAIGILIAFLLSKYIFEVYEIERHFLTRDKVFVFFNWTLFGVISVFTLACSLFIYFFRNSNVSFSIGQNYSSVLLISLTFISFCLFLLGLFQPMFQSQFFFKQKATSLIGSIEVFYSSKEYYLGTLVLVFTIGFPAAKYVLTTLNFLNASNNLSVLNKTLNLVSKFSMLDVWIVALLLLYMKVDSRFIKMELKSGVVYFSISIILLMIVNYLSTKEK